LKKNKILILILIALSIIVVIFVRQNLRNASKQEEIRKDMINSAYCELTTISTELESLLSNIKQSSYESNSDTLIYLSYNFTRLDTILKCYTTMFPRVRYRNDYVINFDFIAHSLISERRSVNDMTYNGILVDSTVSEKEIKYITALRNDIDSIISDMISTENPPQENKNLTTSQIDTILNTFISKWEINNEDSPIYLLRSE